MAKFADLYIALLNNISGAQFTKPLSIIFEKPVLFSHLKIELLIGLLNEFRRVINRAPGIFINKELNLTQLWLSCLLKLKDNFHLTDDADTWSQSEVYQSSMRNVLAISVVKDTTDCGAKSRSDFLAATHSEKKKKKKTLPEYSTSSAWQKKKIPDLRRKRKLNKN